MSAGFLAIIPARLASTRLPRKPLADIAGKPMVVHVAARAREAGAERVLIATDAPEVMEAAARHGLEAMLTSPDHATGTDRLAEVATRLGLADDAVVVNVQGDEPLVPPDLIRDCAGLLLARPDCAIATVAHRLETIDEFLNPNIVKVVLDAHARALYFSRAPIPYPRDYFRDHGLIALPSTGTGSAVERLNAAPPLPTDLPALRHIGLYAYRASFLRRYPSLSQPDAERFECLEQLRALAHGFSIAVHQTPTSPPAGVDTPEDLARVRLVLGQTA